MDLVEGRGMEESLCRRRAGVKGDIYHRQAASGHVAGGGCGEEAESLVTPQNRG